MLTFRVDGKPVPQGSPKIGRHGRMCRACGKRSQARILLDSDELRDWRDDVMGVAVQAISWRENDARLRNNVCPFRREPLVIWARFTFAHTQKSKPGEPKHTRPDLDKLQRAIGDSLEAAGIIDEDSRIVAWPCCPAKVYGERPGVEVRVYTLAEWEERDGVA